MDDRQIQGKPKTQTVVWWWGAQAPLSLSSLPFRKESRHLEMWLQMDFELPSGPREEWKQCSSRGNLALDLCTESCMSPSQLRPASQSVHLRPPPASHGPKRSQRMFHACGAGSLPASQRGNAISMSIYVFCELQMTSEAYYVPFQMISSKRDTLAQSPGYRIFYCIVCGRVQKTCTINTN